jgi:hypothetical protein
VTLGVRVRKAMTEGNVVDALISRAARRAEP